ncbi:hypothetical protein ACIBPB_23980 [Micromonospora sp. NPDC049836]|uniref:hypothetical protein n=1 Tax=Micromonospora sp. NPDC049836 TaxID=3364274 RepID=UPI00379AA437
MSTEAHLQMIQAVVSRLATQSTTVKGWCVTVTAAVLGFGVTTTTPVAVLIAGYVIAAFAMLDSYYLALERAYRTLYNRAVAGGVPPWTLTIERIALRDVVAAFRSPAVVLLYGASLLAALGVGGFLLSR